VPLGTIPKCDLEVTRTAWPVEVLFNEMLWSAFLGASRRVGQIPASLSPHALEQEGLCSDLGAL
jgi:hypothetical protein